MPDARPVEVTPIRLARALWPKVTRFRCVACGKLTTGRVPHGSWIRGTGDFRYPRRHKVNGEPCPGNIREAEWVDVRLPPERRKTHA